MDKYYKESALEESRTTKNKEIYNKVNEEDFDKLSLTSNISIIDADTTNLDIEKLKNLLNERYSTKKSIPDIEDDIEPLQEESLEDTKEYDLKKVIDEAHKNKTPDYDRERFKKLRDTQYDILNNLNLDRSEDPIIEESLTVEEANLMNLIKTVNENSLKKEQIEEKEGDLLDSLKGDDDTEVLEAISFEGEDAEKTGKKPTIVEELEKTKQLSKKELMDEYEKLEDQPKEDVEEPEEVEEDNDEGTKEEPTENTFYTGKLQITDNDLEDFEDLKKEINSGNIFVKILIFIVVLIFIALGVYLLNKYLNLGLF